MYDNRIQVSFGATRSVVAPRRTQYDREQYLIFSGVDLPDTFPVHFSNQEFAGETTAVIGTAANGVLIPDEYFWSGADAIYAFLYLTSHETDAETVYKVTIPLKKRPRPSDVEPTPVEADVIAQTIAALNNGVDRAETAASNAAQSAADAQTAQNAAEQARDSALTYRNTAQEHSLDAGVSALNAASSATAAQQARAGAEAARDTAEQHKTAAGEFADEAEEWAEKAEQSAAQSGYMHFYIENGDLHYQRTVNTHVDFYLRDGDLYVGASV